MSVNQNVEIVKRACRRLHNLYGKTVGFYFSCAIYDSYGNLSEIIHDANVTKDMALDMVKTKMEECSNPRFVYQSELDQISAPAYEILETVFPYNAPVVWALFYQNYTNPFNAHYAFIVNNTNTYGVVAGTLDALEKHYSKIQFPIYAGSGSNSSQTKHHTSKTVSEHKENPQLKNETSSRKISRYSNEGMICDKCGVKIKRTIHGMCGKCYSKNNDNIWWSNFKNRNKGTVRFTVLCCNRQRNPRMIEIIRGVVAQ